MSEELVSVRAICEKHKLNAKLQKKNTIDLLWSTLQSMRAEGAPDYSIARVGRELSIRGGPKAQSIRNENGAYLREIIRAYAEAIQAPKHKQAQAKSNVDRALTNIPDHNVRYILTLEIENARKLREENSALRESLRRTYIQTHNVPPPLPEREPTPHSTNLALKDRLVIALQKGIDPQRLDEVGLYIRNDGAIVDDQSTVLFPPAFVEAIATVLQNGIAARSAEYPGD